MYYPHVGHITLQRAANCGEALRDGLRCWRMVCRTTMLQRHRLLQTVLGLHTLMVQCSPQHECTLTMQFAPQHFTFKRDANFIVQK